MVDVYANLSADRQPLGGGGGHEPLENLVAYSDQLERLLDCLAESLTVLQRRSPLGRIDIVVPHQNMEAWCKLGLSERLGVTANVEFMRARRFFRRLAASIPPDGEGRRVQLADEALFREHLLYLFFEDRHSLKEGAIPREIEEYIGESLKRDDSIARRIQLASRLASLFTLYDESTDFLIQWQEKKSVGFADEHVRDAEIWQRKLWQTIRGRMDMQAEKILLLGQLGKPDTAGQLVLPHATFFFGISRMPLAYLKIIDALAALADRPPLQIFAFNPCREDWSEIKITREISRDTAASGSADSEKGENDFLSSARGEALSLKNLAGNPLLMAMGRTGREYVRALCELSDFNFSENFSDGATDSGNASPDQREVSPILLRQLQRDVRDNVVEIQPLKIPEEEAGGCRGCSDAAEKCRGRSGASNDFVSDRSDSIRIFSCSGIQRECEEAARCAAALLQSDRTLRFGDISILVAGKSKQNAYFSRLKGTLFQAGIPICCSEFRGNSASRVSEAASRLVRLPMAGFSRGAVMNVLSHPSVLANTPSISSGDLASLVDSLGIFYGLDSRDQQKSGAVYLNETDDVFNWDQGLTRIALGLSMCGADFGDRTPFVRNKLEGRAFSHDSGENVPPEACQDRFRGGGGADRFGQAPSVQSPVRQVMYWPAEIPENMRSEAAHWLLMVQSLLADAGFAAEARSPSNTDAWMTMEEWAVFIAEFVETYIVAQDGEEREKGEIVRAARELRHQSLRNFERGNEIRVPYDVAASLYLEVLNRRRAVEGNYLLDGISLSSLSSVLPARHLIVVGLSAGNFPAQTNRSQIDLTREKIIDGDSGVRRDFRRFLVTESEDDRYLFLQAVMSARESLSLFFTARNQASGCSLNPAPPLEDLENLLYSYMPGRLSFRRAVTPCRCDLQYFASLQKIIDGVRPDEKAADSERNACPAASREAAALALREILRLRSPSCMNRAIASRRFLDCRGMDSLPLNSDLRKHLISIFRKLNFLEGSFAPATGKTQEGDITASEEREILPRASVQSLYPEGKCLPVFKVTLGQLCHFLKEPALGSAEALLGLRRERKGETEDAKMYRRDEMFSSCSLYKSIATGDAMARWFSGKADDSDGCAELHSDLLYYQSQGLFPAASFGEAAEQEQIQELGTLQDALKEVFPEICDAESTVVRLGIQEQFPGSGTVSVESPDFSSCGPLTVSGRKFRLSLRGRTEFIWRRRESAAKPNTFAVICLKKNENDALIHSFITAMTCLASGMLSDDPGRKISFRCVVHNQGKVDFRPISFFGVSGEEAKQYLFCLAAKMLSSLNSYRISGGHVLDQYLRSKDIKSREECLVSPDQSWEEALSLSDLERLPPPSDAEWSSAFEGSMPSFRWGFFRDRLDLKNSPRSSRRKS